MALVKERSGREGGSRVQKGGREREGSRRERGKKVRKDKKGLGPPPEGDLEAEQRRNKASCRLCRTTYSTSSSCSLTPIKSSKKIVSLFSTQQGKQRVLDATTLGLWANCRLEDQIAWVAGDGPKLRARMCARAHTHVYSCAHTFIRSLSHTFSHTPTQICHLI